MPSTLDRDDAADEFGDMAAMMLWRPESIGKTFTLRNRRGKRVPVTMTSAGLVVARMNPATEDDVRYALEGLERAWKRADLPPHSLSDAYLEGMRRCIDDARFHMSGGDMEEALNSVAEGWEFLHDGSNAEENPAPSCTKPALFVVKKERTGKQFSSGPITGPLQAVKAARELIGDRAYETFLVMYVNARNCVMGFEELTEDSMSHVSVNTASLVRNALLGGARAIITVHQHPSGSLEPSQDDMSLWHQLSRQAELMGIVVLDDFIVTEDGFFSRLEGGALKW